MLELQRADIFLKFMWTDRSVIYCWAENTMLVGMNDVETILRIIFIESMSDCKFNSLSYSKRNPRMRHKQGR